MQEYIKNFTDLTEKVMGTDPANISNRIIIFLFIKNLYNHEFGHIAKECKNNPSNKKSYDQQEQTVSSPYRHMHNVSPVQPIIYPTTISPTKPPILTQQITTDFQLSQEAWKQLSSQMNKMIKMNKLFKNAVQGTYKKLTNVQEQNIRNSPQPKKSAVKSAKAV